MPAAGRALPTSAAVGAENLQDAIYAVCATWFGAPMAWWFDSAFDVLFRIDSYTETQVLVVVVRTR